MATDGKINQNLAQMQIKACEKYWLTHYENAAMQDKYHRDGPDQAATQLLEYS